MTQFGTWVSFGGDAKIELAIVLLGAAGGVTYAGARLKLPLQPARPRQAAIVFMLSAWVLALVAFLVCFAIYAQKTIQQYPGHRGPGEPILPVTLIAAGLTFAAIFITSPHNAGTRLASSVIGAIAAPMIFELPFDLIVMARIYPPILPDPAAYRTLFFLPLFFVEITTLWLLTLSPMVKLSRGTFFCFAAMLAVFAAWSLDGFAYPSTPLPATLNVLSKLLAFATALSLFLPQRAKGTAQNPAPAKTLMQA
jgi:hypothetical protein